MDRTSPPRNPLDLQLADLLVKPGDKGVIGLLPLVLLPVEDIGRSSQQCLLPCLDLAGWTSYRAASWATVSSPFTASNATLALNDGLCFLRSFDMSHSSFTATAALILGAGLSLSHLSEFRVHLKPLSNLPAKPPGNRRGKPRFWVTFASLKKGREGSLRRHFSGPGGGWP